MWVQERVEDAYKQQAKASLMAFIQQAYAAVGPLEGEIRGLISACDAAIGGAPSGIDRQMTGDCQQALQSVAEALRQLSGAYDSASRLDTTTIIMREIPDPPGTGAGYAGSTGWR